MRHVAPGNGITRKRLDFSRRLILGIVDPGPLRRWMMEGLSSHLLMRCKKFNHYILLETKGRLSSANESWVNTSRAPNTVCYSIKQQRDTYSTLEFYTNMKSKTKTHAIVFSFQTTEYEIGCWGGGQRRLIATFSYDCGSGGGGGGRQQRWLAMAGGSRGWLWLVTAPGVDNEHNGGRGGVMGIATDSFQLPPSYHTLSSSPIIVCWRINCSVFVSSLFGRGGQKFFLMHA